MSSALRVSELSAEALNVHVCIISPKSVRTLGANCCLVSASAVEPQSREMNAELEGNSQSSSEKRGL